MIKVIATGGVLTPGIGATFTAFTPEELEAAVDEAHKWGRGVAAHAIGAEGSWNAVVAGVDSVEHCVQVNTEIGERDEGARYVPVADALRDPRDPRSRGRGARVRGDEGARRSRRRGRIRSAGPSAPGVRHVCGTDAGTPFNPHGNAPRELVYMVQWGMTPLKAMQAATANGAELLRLPLVGTIEEGKEADLVLFEGNPAESIEHVLSPLMVLKAGDVVAGSIE